MTKQEAFKKAEYFQSPDAETWEFLGTENTNEELVELIRKWHLDMGPKSLNEGWSNIGAALYLRGQGLIKGVYQFAHPSDIAAAICTGHAVGCAIAVQSDFWKLNQRMASMPKAKSKVIDWHAI